MESIISKIKIAEKSSLMCALYNIFSVIFGKQPIIRNCPPDIKIDDILQAIIKSNPAKLKITEHYLRLENDDFTFEAWNANRYYAWLAHGIYQNKKTGYSYKWADSMPSRYIAELFRKYVDIIARQSI